MKVYLPLILMALFSSWLRADVYTDKNTGIQFPQSIAAYKTAGVTPYEAAPGEAGVAVAYHFEDAEATVYVRSLTGHGLKSSREFLDETIAGVREMERRGLYENVKFYAFDPVNEVTGWASGTFTSRSSASGLHQEHPTSNRPQDG